MNILHISPYLPSLDENHAGGICMGKQVETLSEFTNIEVLSFIVSEHDKKIAKTLDSSKYTLIPLTKKQKLINIITHLWLPSYFATRSSRKFKKKLMEIVKEKKIDAIHAEYTAMGQYIWIKRKFPMIKFSLIEHDVTEQSYERKLKQETNFFKWIFYKEQLLLIRYWEKKYCNNADNVFTFNIKDKQILMNKYGLKNVIVLNPYYGLVESNSKSRLYIPNSICFVGQMGRKENYKAALKLIKMSVKVKKSIPDLQVFIIGSHPPSQLCKKENEYIHITGFVDDIDNVIKKCQIGVFPLTEGAGIKLKVLKCMTLGLPVVTTPIGSEGIDSSGKYVLIADEEIVMESLIIRILTETTFYNHISLNGSNFVKNKFSWDISRHMLYQIYES